MFTVATLSLARELGAKFELRAGSLSEWVFLRKPEYE